MGRKRSDGKTIDAVAPSGGVVAGEFYRIAGWNGLCEVDTAQTETFAMNVDPQAEFEIKIPAGLTVPVGTILYMPPSTGGVGSTQLTTTVGSNVKAFKVTVTKDANNIIAGKILNGFE